MANLDSMEMAYNFRFDAVYNNLPFLLEGIYLTLFISGLSLVLSMVLGLVVAVGRLSSSRVLSFVSATYVEVFRDTPVLVQLFWVYYVLPILLGVRIDALTASIIGLTLHSAAFLGGFTEPESRPCRSGISRPRRSSASRKWIHSSGL